MVEVMLAYDITGVFFNGGNGSMDACGKLARSVKAHPQAREKGIRIVGIPKTIDNDLAITDHAPGFGSAARYLASSVQELSQDVASLPYMSASSRAWDAMQAGLPLLQHWRRQKSM
jgi:6-phosphofructokinase 1